ncbi:MAG TPA: outer membrane protein assembly factor BamD [Lacibacter sp.]|nr:outer membrane protein assembly factor BamD [Lacibacter sp.]HMO89455.1 outer membrane protein assembly factor BamD [Lacibacter sp.]
MNVMRIIVLIGALFLVLAGCNKKTTVTKILKNKDVEYRLRMAEQFFANKKFSKAQLIYEDLFPILRSDPRFEDLYYKYAYCAFYQRDYMNAENLFKGFLDVFPKSAKAAEVDFMHAYCFYKQSPRVELDQTPTQKTIGFMQAHLNNYPESPKAEEAFKIIESCEEKLEMKDFKGAELYFNLGSYRAAAISFTSLLNHYPMSKRADEYKLMIIKAYYQYASMSVETKQTERFEKVLEEYYDFVDRFPESKLLKDAERYFQNSQNNLKALKNEPVNTKS